MTASNGQCSYVYIDNNGDRHTCSRSVHRNRKYCIFHDDSDLRRGKDYYDALIQHLESDAVDLIDCIGFKIPDFSLTGKTIKRDVDFRDAKFLGDLRLEKCTFDGKTTWLGAEFFKRAVFQSTSFRGRCQFMGCRFHGKTVFVGAHFHGRAVFHGCKFMQLAAIQTAAFFEPAVFHGNTFENDADFQGTTFGKSADFKGTIFRGRANFEGARFTDEVRFDEVNAAQIRGLKGASISFDGAILESSSFWGLRSIDSYSFRNSFLIACNFSDIEFRNCDFTGAVIKSPHSRNWKPDAATLDKSRFVYSDYHLEEHVGYDGEHVKCYEREIGSRVPPDGEFGDARNPNTTLMEFMKEPFKWEFLLDFPQEVQAGVLNYISFFRDYSRITSALDVGVVTENLGKSAKVSLQIADESKRDGLQILFRRYIAHILKPFDRYDVIFDNAASTSADRELLLINLQNEVATNQARFSHALRELSAVQRTVEQIAALLVVKDQHEKEKLYDLVSKAMDCIRGQPAQVSNTITVSPSLTNTVSLDVELRSTIDISLHRLNDALEEITPTPANRQTLEEIREEIDVIRRDQSVQDQPGYLVRVRELWGKVWRLIAKAADYGITNVDKIIRVLEELGKALSK